MKNDESYSHIYLRKRKDHVVVICNSNPLYWEEGIFSYILTSIKEIKKDPLITKGLDALYILTQKGVQYDIK